MSALRRALALLLLTASPAIAEEPSFASATEALGLSGSVRGAYWSSDRELTEHRHFTPMSLWLKVTPDLGDGWGLRAEGWVADERPLRGEKPMGELREALVSWRGEALDVSVGRRIVAWGRADRINPTDVVGSRDYTLLFSDDEEQRRGSLMTTAAYSIGDLTATLYWLPEFRPNVFPILLPEGVHVTDQEGRFDAAQGAVRLDSVGTGFDWAVSYFDGIDRNPDARIRSIDAAGIVVEPRYRRMRAFGADFATNIAQYGIRGEVSYRLQPEREAADLYNKGDAVAAVLGVDRDLSDAVNVNVQYLFQHVFDYDDPRRRSSAAERLLVEKAALLSNQLTRTQQGASFRLGYSALNDTLTLELVAAGFFTDGSAALRPKAAYALTDALKLIGGIDVFFGDDDSFFGQLRDNRTAYLELRYGF